MFRPVGGGLVAEPAVGVGVPPSVEEAVGLAETEQVLGDADLLDPPGRRRLGIGAHRFGPVGPIIAVAEQMEVVIEHLSEKITALTFSGPALNNRLPRR